LFVKVFWDSADFGSREFTFGFDGLRREERGEERGERREEAGRIREEGGGRREEGERRREGCRETNLGGLIAILPRGRSSPFWPFASKPQRQGKRILQ